MKSVPIIEYDGYPHYTNTRVEVVTTEAEVRCEIINLPSVPTSPTPLSSPDKSVGDCSKDDQKDLEYIPKHLFLPWWKKWRRRRKRNQTTLKKDYQGKKIFVIRYGQFHFVIGHPTVKKAQRAHKVKASSLSFFPAWCNSLSSVLCALSLLLSNVAGTQEHLSCNYACAWRGQSCIKKIEICCYPLLFSTLVEWSPKPWECWKFWRSSVLAARHHKHQRNNLVPVIIKMWKEEQDKLVERLSNIGGGVVLSGDGRSDSPGHSAKYGAFTFIEQRINKDVWLVQVSYPSKRHCFC